MEKEKLIALVKKSQSGDAEAIEKLLQYAHTSVSYQCRKMLNNAQDSEDMTQEVLVAIYTKLDTLQEPAAFWKWANQITATRCINALNRTHVEYQFAEDEEGHSILDNLEELDEQAIPDKAIDNAETARMIEEIVGSLPDAQRAATLMFYYNEMSVKEIAKTMKVSENTVKSRLNYARKAIKEKVLDYEKQGVKLYGLSPLPFLLYFLRLAANLQKDEAAAGVMVAEVMAAESAAAGIAAGASAAGAGSAAAAAGGSVATTAAATTTAAGIFAGISAKVVAGVLAAVVTIGSVAAVVIPNTQADTTEPAAVPTESTSVMGTESIPETEAPTTETITEPTEPETTESVTQAPTEQSTVPDETQAAGETQPAQCKHNYTSETVQPTCTSAGYTRNTCTKCGNVVKAGENAALDHDWDEGEIIENATCETDGSKTYTCQRNGCGQTKTEKIAALGHDWDEWFTVIPPTVNEEGLETRTCRRDGCYEAIGTEERVIPKLPSDETEPVHQHSYERKVTAEPTCSNDGIATYTCSCGASYTESIAAEHHYECTDTRPATCSNTGDKTYTCKNCGHSYKETLPKNEHKWSEWVITKEPTTTTYGKKVRTCELCHGAQEANIDPLPAGDAGNTGGGSSADCARGKHNYVRIVDKEATCGDRGQYHSECSVCGELGVMDYLPATGNHTWGDWTAWEQSDHEMTRNRSCMICGYTETETVITDTCEKNGHTISAADRAKIENWGDEYRIYCICGEFNAFGKTRDEALAALNVHAAEKKYSDCGNIRREGWGHRHYIPAYNCTVCGESRGNYSIWQECDGNCTACHVR